MSARVLWLIKGLGLGGAERLLALTAARIDRARFDVEVAYLLPWKDALVPELEGSGVRTTCLGAKRTTDPAWVRRLRRLLRSGDHDLIHTHSPVVAVAARMLAGGRVPVVHTEHNVWERYRWATYAANAATYGRNAAVIAVSDGVARSIRTARWTRAVAAPPVETLHHGVDVDGVPRGEDARAAARVRLGIPPHAPVIGTVGNFNPKKDHAGLLAAVDILRRGQPDVVALLVGSGMLEDRLRAEAADRGLADHVRFLGSRDDVLELLPALDVFVLSSRYEGLPIALLEAMAAGVPAVATRVGGVPEAVEHGRQGLLVAPGDPDALATAVSKLLDDPQLRHEMARAATGHVRTRFSIGRAVRRIEEVYDQLLDART